MITPRIGSGFDRQEPVAAVIVGHRAAGAGEIRIEGRRVVVDGMRVPSGRIALPDLNQRTANGAGVFIEHTAGDDDPLAKWLAGMLTCQVSIRFADPTVAV